jgi:nucleotide-binding universal stress UspA family protein
MFKKILCATDLNRASIEAVKKTIQIAKQFNSRVLMLNVHDEFMTKEEMSMLRVSIEDVKIKFERVAIESKSEMKNIVDHLKAGNIDIEYKLMEGKAHKIICKESVSQNIDLIVMGVSEKNSLTSFIFNSTASYVIEHVDIPVLVVPIKNI